MGLKDPGLWITLGSVVTGAGTLAGILVRPIRDIIVARRDIKLAQLALKDSTPEQRGQILDGLAKIRQFNPDVRPDEPVEPPALPAVRGRGRGR
ncbi:hypothetical protein [Phytohabitans aurantiacus]|uniref:YtxH domain-containing protein n=1 Tax=Phytohabitans aurantiacus TaxID=3016789 RepID=A0ABQ5R1I5_9ACTN|nr:hypothetical protein [Phytohabitans aurantiacus]GLI00677.1 hypothetical protein Pa4123_59530 [Phytohabitans aurantiacus]